MEPSTHPVDKPADIHLGRDLGRARRLEFLRKYGTILGALPIFVFFSIATSNFFTTVNIMMLLRQMSMLCIVSLGFTFVMAGGGFDMSVGNATGLVNILFAAVLMSTKNMLVSMIVALAVGIAVGLGNGFLIAYVGLPDFIGTFAVGSIAYGIKMLFTKGNPIFLVSVPEAFYFIGQGHIGPVPIPVVIMFAVLAIASFVLGRTVLGRRINAIGGNPVAAMYAGIDVRRHRLVTFLISGLSVSIAAIILTSRLGSGQPLAGEDFCLDAISSVFLSTTMLGEGEPTAVGSFIGALIISMLNNGLTMMNVPYYFQYITKGAVVIVAVMLSVLLGRRARSVA